MKRLIISFSARCALSCSYCYAPFNGIAPTEKILSKILQFAQSENIDVLTFGGGDPFQYIVARNAIRESKRLGFFVHVDTHGIGLREADFELIHDNVDLMGLPLDGSEEVHNHMRSRPGHFECVTATLKSLINQKTKVKINTVVSRLNIESLETLAEQLEITKPTIWSLYQYMQLPQNPQANKLHTIADNVFNALASRLGKLHPNLKLEIGNAHVRNTGYLFVQTDGTLFTHASNAAGYQTLGHINSPEWRQKFEALHQTMLPELSKTRYA
ncbi:MAG: radical SAM protein [Verrucomicrobia bacterium]|nr:radical SAM protein [Verrucomicrobiota bacterium]